MPETKYIELVLYVKKLNPEQQEHKYGDNVS